MDAKSNLTKGTIYLHGAPSRFQPAIYQALGLKPAAEDLSFKLSIDIIRSIVRGEPVYRVDYTLKKAIKETALEPASQARAGRFLAWFYSLFSSRKGPAETETKTCPCKS
jgi:hypothetical protein